MTHVITWTSPARVRRGLLALGAVLSVAGCTANTQSAEPQGTSMTHHTADGYENNYSPLPRASLLKWQWERLVNGLPKPPANGYHFPVDHPDVAWIKANRTETTLTWIGHATALLQMNGVNIITDPMFSKRASPFQFIGPERKVPPGLALADLPHIDIVLISHNHYDHLDTASVEQLNKQAGGPPLFLVPMGIKSWMHDKGIDNVQELDWWNETHASGLDLFFVPSRHWSARGIGDRQKTLWGGWVVKTPEGNAHPFSFYFAGDTGYSPDFKDIGNRFGSFDLSLIPIGAYAPEWFMRPQHVNPFEAVQIHEDVHSKKSIGIHWGTFELADDPLDEPPRLLKQAVKEAGLPEDAFVVLRHGQMIKLGDAKTPGP
ncbi:MBL fold metallo-hydrolase [Burkholderia sp. PAMC 26561]|nr:MBL fold metallo-hydrolase [Burkholderia sp. PAMC 26561]